MVGRMIKRSYDPEFLSRCFNQIKGFGDYGFPETHAAETLPIWSMCQRKMPLPTDIFCATLLSNRWGFMRLQIVRDTREHGKIVACAGCELQSLRTARLVSQRCFLRHVGAATRGRRYARNGLWIVDAGRNRYRSGRYQGRAQLGAAVIRLALADAFRSMTLDRRQALWDARALRDAPVLPLLRK
jgi:error-prone DNA polymerase